MELRDLRYFVVVSEELNFARSAERLHIAPSAVSERIRRLEDELGSPLFKRTSRRVTLTANGHELIGAARRALAASDEFSALAGSLRLERPHSVLLAFAPNLGHHAGALLNRLAERTPEAEVDARSMWSAEALEALERRAVSTALVRVPVTSASFKSQLLGVYTDDFVALPEDHSLARQDAVPVKDLEGESVLVSEAEIAPHVHNLTAQLFREQGVDVRFRRHRLQSYDSVLALVSAGTGAALVHSHLAGLAIPGVTIRPLAEPGPRYELRVVWRADDGSAGVRAVRDAAASLLRP